LALKHAYRANKRPSEFDEVKKFISDVVEPRHNSIYVGNCNRPSAYGTFALLGNIHYGTVFTSTSLSDDIIDYTDRVIEKCSPEFNVSGYCASAIGDQTQGYNNGTSIWTLLESTNYYPISTYDFPQYWGIQYAPYVYSTNPLTLLMYGSWTASSSWTRNYILNGVAYYYSHCGMTFGEPVFYAYNSSGFSVSNGVSYVTEWEIIYS